MSAGIKANNDGSGAIQVGGSDYITISSAGAVAIPQTLAVTGAATAASLQVGGVTTNLYPLVSGTAVASTSGTSIDFTSIPAYAKRITVMFDGVSTNGTSNVILQLGDSGGIEDTGYVGSHSALTTSGVSTNSNTTHFTVYSQSAASNLFSGLATISLLSGTTWAASGTTGSAVPRGTVFGGSKTLSGTLDRVRITSGNGTDVFDAGSINIMWE
jgi:hypothetical protein